MPYRCHSYLPVAQDKLKSRLPAAPSSPAASRRGGRLVGRTVGQDLAMVACIAVTLMGPPSCALPPYGPAGAREANGLTP